MFKDPRLDLLAGYSGVPNEGVDTIIYFDTFFPSDTLIRHQKKTKRVGWNLSKKFTKSEDVLEFWDG